MLERQERPGRRAGADRHRRGRTGQFVADELQPGGDIRQGCPVFGGREQGERLLRPGDRGPQLFHRVTDHLPVVAPVGADHAADLVVGTARIQVGPERVHGQVGAADQPQGFFDQRDLAGGVEVVHHGAVHAPHRGALGVGHQLRVMF